MIYTCTLNPSIDYIMWMENFQEGKVNRSQKEVFQPGGKGINVSILLNNIQIESTTLGFLGGFLGKLLLTEINKKKYLKCDFVQVEGNTRLNITIHGDVESKINAKGPDLSENDYLALLDKIKHIKEGDVFILSGSIPPSIKNDAYHEIAQLISENKACLIVDTTKEQLINVLSFKPFLIKPNKEELEEVFGVKTNDDKDIIKYAKMLIEMGAKNVLVSLGEEGAILVTQDQIFRSFSPKGTMINSVGAGDSMLAGFIAEYLKSNSFFDALKFATACGCATAFSEEIAQEKEIKLLYPRINVQEINI